MLVGTAVLGATLLLGYTFGRGENVEHAAHKAVGKWSAREQFCLQMKQLRGIYVYGPDE